MPEEETKKVYALVNVDTSGLGEAAKQFVDVMKDAVTGICRPWQIRRVGDAECDATLAEARVDIRVQGLYRRAAERWLNEEVQKQANMEAIAAQAVPHIKASARPHKIEPDWLTNFFAQARLFSDADMQALWAKILAGEANGPGLFSKRAINAMGLLEKRDAESFQYLCQYAVWIDGEYHTIIMSDELEGKPRPTSFYRDQLMWNLPMLEEFGLIRLHKNEIYEGICLDRYYEFELRHHDRAVCLAASDGVLTKDLQLPMGFVKLTTIGNELAPVCSVPCHDDFVAYLQTRWKNLLK